MPPLNWEAFAKLPGSLDYNYEMLCRALIRRQYGRYGRFTARANQPGVEFHLKLDMACALGEPGRWFGWQCRWYDLPAGRALGSARRRKIAEAIATTERELPDLTDWVLWTRRPLAKGDQDWFYGLQTHMRLILWTATEVEEHLSGDAEILRGTYFGDLVLTVDSLARLHEVAVAPIRRRWQPEVHQILEAERVLRQVLAETETWNALRRLSGQLRAEAAAIDGAIGGVTGSLADALTEIVTLARAGATALSDAHVLLTRGDLDLLRQELAPQPSAPGRKLVELPRQLRARRHHSGLIVTNALADLRRAAKLLNRVDTYLSKRLIAVIAGAGCGKTQLAAQITSAASGRPAGILLHGGELHAGHGLDDLAHHVVIEGRPVPSMEALIAAIDAAGQRAHRRLPIVIDGLNEAEDPREWKAPLASLNEILRAYPYVFVVCTLRTAFADEALPLGVDRLEIPGFGHDTIRAIRRYFTHYRINAADAELPVELLSHPLTLRLFCEVANPKRDRDVGIESLPASLTGLFERYLDQAAERIADLAPRTRRYRQQDIRTALDEIGWALWEEKVRQLDLSALRRRLGDDRCLWNESIIRALEQDGILLREAGEPSTGSRVGGVFDSLSGYLVANAALTRLGWTGLVPWLKEQATLVALTGPFADRHPLAADIFRALVGLVPRRLHRQQLWSLLEEPLRTEALREAAELEGAYLDAATVEALFALATHDEAGLRYLLGRLWQTRGASAHPLNSDFLDAILRPMSVVERDLRWTEWIRRNRDRCLADLEWLENQWRNRTDRSLADRLRARWVMWTLTSTVRRLRDQATHVLYWFGRGDPAALFDLTIEALTINDVYVSERMLAAAYGTAMALHSDPANQDFVQRILSGFALRLYRATLAEGAPHSTTHALMRDFARHTIQLALLHNSNLLNSRECRRIIPPFRDGGIRKWGRHPGFGQKAAFGYGGPLHMDFANYTLGQLVPDRANYNFTDTQYTEIVENVYWRLVQLGYSPAVFEEIDKAIASSHWHGRSEGNDGRVDRYGKKYSWIAFYELYGLRYDQGLLKGRYSDSRERPPDVDIDPSFPSEPRDTQVIIGDWLGDRRRSIAAWIEHGERPNIMPYLVLNEVGGHPGPWVLLDGSINQVDERHKRGVYALPRGLLVPKRHSQEIRRLLADQNLGKLHLPRIPGDYYTFAGEIAWCDTFPKHGRTNVEFHAGYAIKKVPRDEVRLFREGKRLNKEETDALLRKMLLLTPPEERDQAIRNLLETEKVTYRVVRTLSTIKEPVLKTVPVLLPVRENNWESHHSGVNPGQHAIVPAREIAEDLGLFLRPPSWDMYDRSGLLAAMSIKWGDLWLTGHNLCFLREDILRGFLRRHRLDLIWAFWGAREVRSAPDEYHYQTRTSQRSTLKHSRKEFQRIYYYRDGRVAAGKASEHYS